MINLQKPVKSAEVVNMLFVRLGIKINDKRPDIETMRNSLKTGFPNEGRQSFKSLLNELSSHTGPLGVEQKQAVGIFLLLRLNGVKIEELGRDLSDTMEKEKAYYVSFAANIQKEILKRAVTKEDRNNDIDEAYYSNHIRLICSKPRRWND